MCGIAGLFNAGNEQTLRNMLQVLKRRGPDNSGVWIDNDVGLQLGHTRLSIQDVSSAGAQPMISRCGQFVIVLNGEIYNHIELRKHLLSDVSFWRGSSDTETLVELIARFGLEKTVDLLVGMFAIAVFDVKKSLLTLVRDRVGEKPLYWSATDTQLIFASDIEAIRVAASKRLEVSEHSVFDYFEFGYVPTPFSIYENVNKLEPGTYLSFSLKYGQLIREYHNRYWNFEDIVNSKCQLQGSPDVTVSDIEKQLKLTIQGQLISDVPLGVFLSGGIDSSLVASLMMELSATRIKTFSIGFLDQQYNEASHAKLVSDLIGSDHTEFILGEEECLSTISELSNAYSEPFADSSQIPSYLISKLAAEHVTVALTGDGGDEVFGGYNRHIYLEGIHRVLRLFPANTAKLFETSVGYNALRAIAYLMNRKRLSKTEVTVSQNLTNKLYKGTQLIGKNTEEVYDTLTKMPFGDQPITRCRSRVRKANGFSNIESAARFAMAQDTVSYLPDDILVKMDRAAMYHSLETRAPFLDHRLIELAWKTPVSENIASGKGKLQLRSILQKYIPQEVFDRPKAGFAVPLSEWLRGPLKEFAEDTFHSTLCTNDNFVKSSELLNIWECHLKNRKDYSSVLWAALMFFEWKRQRL